MDINIILASLRSFVERPNNYDPEVVADLFRALDEWLSKGGFLPTDWQRSLLVRDTGE